MSKRANSGQIETHRVCREEALPAMPQRTRMPLAAWTLLLVTTTCSSGSGTSNAYGSGGGAGTAISTGGRDQVGGASSGGASSGGGSKGTDTGGLPSGGSPTGGLPSGGSPTGGLPSGGSATGGLPSGGSATGGLPSGGSATGGLPSGGSATGGLPSGGSASGGLPSGGSATGGLPSGGSASGGQSSGGGASDPFSVPETCTSGTTWRSGTGPTMRPGEACFSCHSSGFAIAGTVYPTGHEPDDCNGAGSAGALVVVTDANGQEHELTVNQAGNFTLSGSLAVPYTARVVLGTAERAMGSSQSSGNCNGCHTQSGSNGAPGRIVLP
jgi:hypothetical protein